MLGDYIEGIIHSEHLHGKTDKERTNEILCKYFKEYTFANRKEAVEFFLLFNEETDKNTLAYTDMVLTYAAGILGRNYNVFAEMDGLTIRIEPRPNVYSYNDIEGWHEGYDPFIGDVNECYGNTLEEAMKSLYVKDTHHHWTHFKTNKMGLITEKCGYGKTHWVEHELIDEINEAAFVWNDLKIFDHYEKKDILFITTRRSILDQQVEYGEVVSAVEEDFSNSSLSWMEERPNKVRIITTSKLGSLYKEGKIEKMFPIVVVDELHSLFLDTLFAEESYYAIECIFNEFWEGVVKIGLTATPKLLFDYIDTDGSLFYALDDNPLPHKYNTDNLKYMPHTYLNTVLKTVHPSADYKVLVYCSSAKNAIACADRIDNARFLISKYSKYTEAVERQQDLYNYIVENNKLPDDVYMLFMTSAYREGVEIKDDSVKEILIDASDEITISQFTGRMRGDVKEVKIITNKHQEDRLISNAEKYNKLINGTYEDLAEQYGRQIAAIERNENVSLLVQKMKGKYEINIHYFPIMKYLLDCYNQATNEENYKRLVSVGDRKMLTKQEYFESFLNGYSKTSVVSSDIDKERANWSAADLYLFQKLYKPNKDELCIKLNWYDTKNNRLVKWPSIKTELVKRGYKISSGRDSKGTYDIISI